jgi:2-C-methyl-D-erythritol 4-phosphate cytidylyltransferase
VQTPQGFRRSTLDQAHASGADATDDAGLVELLGGKVLVVVGESVAVKVTTPGDLRLLEDVVRSANLSKGRQ